ncbi:hypothetical protein B7494_g3057 [Chlorociboria aeruginascens]|nr:hypothetical protein B7494_g3057 [Chlorociboria aeruginascens]
MADSVRTQFLVMSDTHNFEFRNNTIPFGKAVPRVDVLLHCGDLTMTGGLVHYRKLLEMVGSIDAELKLVIAGNHDLSLDAQYWQTHLGPKGDPTEHEEAVALMRGPLARAAGVTYLEEGLKTFTLNNGAKFTIYTSPYQPEFCDWAFPYNRDEDRFNIQSQSPPGCTSIARNPIPDFPDVDIMMTHGPPEGILDETAYDHVGCMSLMHAVARAKPLLYCFGHIHEAYGAKLITWKDDPNVAGAERIAEQKKRSNTYPVPDLIQISHGEQTLMVNAAIRDLRYMAVNAPWLLELELPRAT